jgi:hypothetical protein
MRSRDNYMILTTVLSLIIAQAAFFPMMASSMYIINLLRRGLLNLRLLILKAAETIKIRTRKTQERIMRKN